MTGERMVAVEREGPQLSMHDPEELPSTFGMDIVPESEVDGSAVKCSVCFEEQDGVFYDFAYTNGGMPV